MFDIGIHWQRWLLKIVIFIACLMPFLFLLDGALKDDLGANPIETVTHATGDWTLRLLLITLVMTPLRRLTGLAWPIKVRRMLGLFVFFYATLHFFTWGWLDQQLIVEDILADIVKRPYVTVGFLAWLLLLPLALTSNRWSMRKLGKRWSILHKVVYLIGVLGVLHFLWLVKADLLEPLIYGLLLVLLLAFRWKHAKQSEKKRLTERQGKLLSGL